MPTAQGIQDHPNFKLGLKPPKNGPALELGRLLTGNVPAHPTSADHIGNVTFGLDENDKFGDCGPTSVDNLTRLVSTGLTGSTVQATQDGVFDLYRRSGNPDFDPTTDADDNGVDMQTMLEAFLAGGITTTAGQVTPLAFAKIDPTNDDEIEAAVSIFGGVLFGVNLMVAQQAQTDAKPPEWKYKKSAEWGGHAVMCGAYEARKVIDLISWAMRVKTLTSFRSKQLQEVWAVVFPWHIQHPAFQMGVNLKLLTLDYADLTGKTLVIPKES